MPEKRNLRDIILKLQSEGKSVTEVSKTLNCSTDTVYYHFYPDYVKRKNIDKKRRRRENKRKLIEFMGGKCQECGYNKCDSALQFHHENPEDKKFAISEGKTTDFNKLLEEAKKCILLCANCHAEIESNL